MIASSRAHMASSQPWKPLSRFSQRRSYVISSGSSDESTTDATAIRSIPTLSEAISNPKYAYPDPQSFPSEVPTPYFKYELVYQSKNSAARVGRIHTPHGIIDTPGFVPVATNAALKFIDMGQQSLVEALDTQLIFANTYHLMIHPGAEVIEAAGGVHKYTKYNRPMITDSGGFQVFSMANTTSQDELKGKVKRTDRNTGKSAPNLLKKISESGAIFRSYREGKLIELTPQSSVQAQKKIGADIIIPLDILLPNAVKPKKLLEAFHRTHRWEAASLKEHLSDLKQQAMYAVLHGGTNLQLRELSLNYLSQLPFQGLAIGGSLGKNSKEMYELLDALCPQLPRQFPVHLLGIGDPPSVEYGSKLGIDTFDSAYPTKNGRHGRFFTTEGAVEITKPRYANVHNKPPVEGCECPTYVSGSLSHNHLHFHFTMSR